MEEMLGFKEAKRFFLDREKVRRTLDQKLLASFARFGGYTKSTASRSIKDPKFKTVKGERVARKKALQSTPGNPPLSPTGILPRSILFYVDPRKKSVVIGPVKLSRKTTGAPKNLEYGGTTVVNYKTGARGYISPRPYMRPAFGKALAKFPALAAQRG